MPVRDYNLRRLRNGHLTPDMITDIAERVLRALGFDVEEDLSDRIDASSIHSGALAGMVRAFQAIEGLQVDGLAGAGTVRHLRALAEARLSADGGRREGGENHHRHDRAKSASGGAVSEMGEQVSWEPFLPEHPSLRGTDSHGLEYPATSRDVERIFGRPGNTDSQWYKQNIIVCRNQRGDRPTLPGVSPERWVKVHRLVEPFFREALHRARQACPAYFELFGGTLRCGAFNYRHMRHDTDMPLSMHSWGICCDIEPAWNRGITYRRGKCPAPWSERWWKVYPRGMPRPIVDAFYSCGFSWGGDWDGDGLGSDQSYSDPMHFQWYGNQTYVAALRTGRAQNTPPARTPREPSGGIDIVGSGQPDNDPDNEHVAQEIAEAQALLATLGYFDGKVGDAENDENWRSDLSAFQKAYKLRADGIYGPRTDAKLTELSKLLAQAPPEMRNGGLRPWTLTYYYLADETAYTKDGPRVPMRTNAGHVIAMVPYRFFAAAALEGSARLADGRMVNVANKPSYCPCRPEEAACLVELARKRKWLGRKNGYAGIRAEGETATHLRAFSVVPDRRRGQGYGVQRGIPYVPFRTLAADLGVARIRRHDRAYVGKGGVVPAKTPVFILEFLGKQLPDGSIHDGWCTVNDTGGGIFGAHFDVFTGTRAWGKQARIPGRAHIWFAGMNERIPFNYDYGLH